ncbi:MAG: LysR family transcriptional regulator [Onishia taeanensis]|uniref:LysR family transcriptional regulator n=1 Tax=Onishia taeanensis TaxID=284577 RepID=UPI003C7E91B6
MLDWQDIQVFLEVAHSERLTDAARRLGVDHSTLSRRTKRFEQKLNTQLFERSTHGYRLTEAGHRLQAHAEEMARHATEAAEGLSDQDRQLSGQVRLGVTEGFGTWVIAPLLAAFGERHPALTLDLLALPRVVNLSRHEADLAITVERPSSAGLVISRLCDYRLRLYGSRDYLARHGRPTTRRELVQHRLIGYIDDLIFSDQLNYLEPLLEPPLEHPHETPLDSRLSSQRKPRQEASSLAAAGASPENVRHAPQFSIRSTSVTTQYSAAVQGAGLAVLPCFMAEQHPALEAVLVDDIDLTRQFWITARQEQRRLSRVRLTWEYLRETVEANRAFLMGEPGASLTCPSTGPSAE